MAFTITGDAASFIQMPDVRAHLNITSTDHDMELQLIADSAQEAVEGLIGPVLHQSVTEPVRVSGGEATLTYAPVVSVESATSRDGLVDAVTYSLNTRLGVLRDVNATGVLDVTYTAGRSSVPASVRLAALIIADHMWQTQRGIAPSPLADAEGPAFGIGYAIPNRALDLLRPYLLPTGIG